MQEVSIRMDSDCAFWVTSNDCIKKNGPGKSVYSDKQKYLLYFFKILTLTLNILCFAMADCLLAEQVLVTKTSRKSGRGHWQKPERIHPRSSQSEMERVEETGIRDDSAGSMETLASKPVKQAVPLWMTDFEQARKRAEQEKKMLLVFFHTAKTERPETAENDEPIRLVGYHPGNGRSDLRPLPLPRSGLRLGKESAETLCRQFEEDALADPEVISLLEEHVLVRVSTDSPIFREERFHGMVSLPGLAMLDYRDEEAEYHGEVVGYFPFLKGRTYNAFQTRIMLTLPPGTATQRLLIYAVRIHPDRPLSTQSESADILRKESTGHSDYMARIGVQGHQNFDARFRRISAELGRWEVSEVCAESWPGESILEAALSCVDAWRSSSGHWRGVSGRNRYYSYDMRRGRNGIWYATGLFSQ